MDNEVKQEPDMAIKRKIIMLRNGAIMKDVMDYIVEKIMVKDFGLIDDGEERKTPPILKEALVTLLKARDQAMQVQSDRQAMHAAQDYGKPGKLPTWITTQRHVYPSIELSHICQASNTAVAAFRGRTVHEISMDRLSLEPNVVSDGSSGRGKQEDVTMISIKEETSEDMSLTANNNSISEGSSMNLQDGEDLAGFLGDLANDVIMTLPGSPTKTTMVERILMSDSESGSSQPDENISQWSATQTATEKNPAKRGLNMVEGSSNQVEARPAQRIRFKADLQKSQTVIYTWPSLKAYIMDSHIQRAQFEGMPATLCLLSDMFFRCQTLTDNRAAQVAVMKVKNMVETLKKAPTLIAMRDMISYFEE
ncbi:hypothetical protein L210DRAFT_936072, partial [Boletus edulis BED1]